MSNLTTNPRPTPEHSEPAVLASLECEHGVLATLLFEPALLAAVLECGLRAEHFYLDSNRRIFGKLLEMADSAVPIDLASVIEALRRSRELEVIGGLPYLFDLTDRRWAIPVRDHVVHHAGVIVKYAKLRKLRKLGERAVYAIADGADPAQLAKLWIEQLRGIAGEK